MKRSELIRQLMAAAPENEDPEVTVGKVDIWFVGSTPEFYDGPTQIATERGENGWPLKGEYRRSHNLIIDMHTRSFSDAMWGCDISDFEIDYSALSERDQEYTKKYHDSIRQSVKEIETDGNRRRFIEWAMQTFPVREPDFKEDCIGFFNDNVALLSQERRYDWSDLVCFDEEGGELALCQK